MHHWPHLPRSLASGEQVILDFVTNGGEGISVDKSEVGEENTHEDWTPDDLIDGNLREDRDGISSWDFVVEPVVEVVSRRAVVDETEERKSGKTLVINGSSSNEDLMTMVEATNFTFSTKIKTMISKNNDMFSLACFVSITCSHSPVRANLQEAIQQEK